MPSPQARSATTTRSMKGVRLGVSANRRHLVTDDGAPFFYLADTAWTLFKRLDHDDLDRYFANRLAKGFSVIQAYVLRGLEMVNLYGNLPLVDRDPTKLSEPFFANVDYAVNRANEMGLVMGLVATMGEHVRTKANTERWPRNEQIFNVDNAFRFGQLLGARYRDNAVIWLLGGDRNPIPEDVATWDAMARGMKDGSGGVHMVSYHGGGASSSSEHFHNFDWLDFNTIQSRHASADPNYTYVETDYALTPTKPTFDMESRYEDYADGAKDGTTKARAGHPVFPRIEPAQIRSAAYWAVFAGAAGHGYGHNDIWQMADERKVDSTKDYSFPHITPRNNWFVSIDAPGAVALSHLRRLIEMRPWHEAAPDQSAIVSGQGDGEDHVQVLRHRDGAFLLAYLTFGNPVTIDTSRLSGKTLVGSWFDPRLGTFAAIGSVEKGGPQTFTPPSSGPGHDWVLVLDDAARAYPVA